MEILGNLALATVARADTARKRAPAPKAEALMRRRVYPRSGERHLPVCETIVREGRRHRGNRQHGGKDKADGESRSQHSHVPSLPDVLAKSGTHSHVSGATQGGPVEYGCKATDSRQTTVMFRCAHRLAGTNGEMSPARTWTAFPSAHNSVGFAFCLGTEVEILLRTLASVDTSGANLSLCPTASPGIGPARSVPHRVDRAASGGNESARFSSRPSSRTSSQCAV